MWCVIYSHIIRCLSTTTSVIISLIICWPFDPSWVAYWVEKQPRKYCFISILEQSRTYIVLTLPGQAVFNVNQAVIINIPMYISCRKTSLKILLHKQFRTIMYSHSLDFKGMPPCITYSVYISSGQNNSHQHFLLIRDFIDKGFYFWNC